MLPLFDLPLGVAHWNSHLPDRGLDKPAVQTSSLLYLPVPRVSCLMLWHRHPQKCLIFLWPDPSDGLKRRNVFIIWPDPLYPAWLLTPLTGILSLSAHIPVEFSSVHRFSPLGLPTHPRLAQLFTRPPGPGFTSSAKLFTRTHHSLYLNSLDC